MERRERIEHLLNQALGRPRAERRPFLDEACAGDTEMRAEIEVLLGQDSAGLPSWERSSAHDHRIENSQVGRYRILRSLGGGGMGEVYRARDDRLERDVALKVLPSEVAADPERLARFAREAKALAALDHPHVVQIYSVEESEGIHFITMQLVDGMPLTECVQPSGISVDALLDIAIPLADALRAAHERGIVHRDLKPSNVMVDSEGRVKVLDFGVAKMRDVAARESSELTTETSTRAGMVLGTLPYMSPQQAEGRSLDHRTDIFSLGVMLYELATGERPFRGDSTAALISSILRDTPPPVTLLNRELPAELARIVRRCLEKEPNRRFQTAKELRNELQDLRRELESGVATSWRKPWRRPPWRGARSGPRLLRWGWLAAVIVLATVLGLDVGGLRRGLLGVGGDAPIRSLAVLPLRNLSGDTSQEYFVDGVTEALITDLSKIGALKVISRTSSMRFKQTDKSLPEIAAELDVEAIVEGSVVQEAGKVRVTAQLIRAATDENLWAESYERDLASILALQREIARSIAGEIRLQVTAQESSRLATTRPIDPAAYDAYLKGQFHYFKLSPDDLEIALRYFETALEREPAFAPAYTGVASVWGGRRQMGFASREESMARGLAALTRAIELDDTSAQAHSMLAAFRTWGEWDWAGAEVEFRRSLELDPNLASAHSYFSHFLNITGRPEEALFHIERAIVLDPLNEFVRGFYGVDLIFARRYEEAIEELERAIATSPNLPFALESLAISYWLSGRLDECVAVERRAMLAFGEPEVEHALAEAYQDEGAFEAAMRSAAQARSTHSSRANLTPYSVAVLYIIAGETGAALDWLERGYESFDSGLPYIGMPMWDSVREHPRFQRLHEKMGLPRAVGAEARR